MGLLWHMLTIWGMPRHTRDAQFCSRWVSAQIRKAPVVEGVHSSNHARRTASLSGVVEVAAGFGLLFSRILHFETGAGLQFNRPVPKDVHWGKILQVIQQPLTKLPVLHSRCLHLC